MENFAKTVNEQKALWDLMKELISRLHLSEFILADNLNKAFSFWSNVLHTLEMRSLKIKIVKPSTKNWKVAKGVPTSKNHEIIFLGILDHEIIMKPYFKSIKASLKIIYFVYYLMKCFFTKKLGIFVSITVEFLADKIYHLWRC